VTGIPAVDYPTPAQRPVNSCLDTTRLVHAFGISVPTWEVALATCLAPKQK